MQSQCGLAYANADWGIESWWKARVTPFTHRLCTEAAQLGEAAVGTRRALSTPSLCLAKALARSSQRRL